MLSFSRLQLRVKLVAMLGMVSLSCLFPVSARSFINENDLVNAPHQEDKTLEFSANFTSSSLKKTTEQPQTNPNGEESADNSQSLDQAALEDNNLSSEQDPASESTPLDASIETSTDSTDLSDLDSSTGDVTTPAESQYPNSSSNANSSALANDSTNASVNVGEDKAQNPASLTQDSNSHELNSESTLQRNQPNTLPASNLLTAENDSEIEQEIEDFYSSHYSDSPDTDTFAPQDSKQPISSAQSLTGSSLDSALKTSSKHHLSDSSTSSLKDSASSSTLSSQYSTAPSEAGVQDGVAQNSSLSTNAPLGTQAPQVQALSDSNYTTNGLSNIGSKYGYLGLQYNKGNVGFGTANLEQDPNTEQDNSIKDPLPNKDDTLGVSSEDSAPLNTLEKDAFLYIPDYSANINELKQRANEGSVESQLQLAFMYASGDGVKADLEQAFMWFTQAAEHGNVDAQFYLGMMYLEGDGINQAPQEAFKWFSQSAEQGNADAQCALGMLYHEGKGTQQDLEQAFNWFTKAAAQDNSDAQFNLGNMYEQGEFVAKDIRQAMIWFEKSCELGDQDACFKANELSAKLQDMEQRLESNESSLGANAESVDPSLSLEPSEIMDIPFPTKSVSQPTEPEQEQEQTDVSPVPPEAPATQG